MDEQSEPRTPDSAQVPEGTPRDSERARVGDIVQVHPAYDVFGACLVVVSEVKSWGIQGYVQNAGQQGQAYIRLKWDDIEATGGRAVWVQP